MNEESQLDAMRAAIRGDFERLAERRGEQELMRVQDEAAPASPVDVLEEPAPEPVPDLDSTPEPELEALLEPEPAAEAEPTTSPDEPPRRSWLARLLGS